MNFGPQSSPSHTLSKATLGFMQRSTQYISQLSPFKKYCVWRYTIGSASINKQLIFGEASENSIYWVYLFFLYLSNTINSNGSMVIPPTFKKYGSFIANPELSKSLSIEMAGKIITFYIKELSSIISNGPKPKGPGIDVFKVSSTYPGLPNANDKISPQGVNVLQLPFNSSTLLRDFNFAPFIAQGSDCCFFEIHIPANTPCLFVPGQYHAYPFETEVLLLPGSIFRVSKISKGIMNYIDANTVNIDLIQPKDNISMGPVYDIDTYKPCKSGACQILSKVFNIYQATLKI